jgi:HD superfamily phosphodiesterase
LSDSTDESDFTDDFDNFDESLDALEDTNEDTSENTDEDEDEDEDEDTLYVDSIKNINFESNDLPKKPKANKTVESDKILKYISNIKEEFNTKLNEFGELIEDNVQPEDTLLSTTTPAVFSKNDNINVNPKNNNKNVKLINKRKIFSSLQKKRKIKNRNKRKS